MSIFIEEFLYRGRPDGDSAWHVVLGVEVDDGFGGVRVNLKGPMTPGQAEALGFPLGKVVAEMNSVALADVDQLKQAKAEAEAQATEALRAMTEKYQDAVVSLSAATSRSADLKARLAAKTTELAATKASLGRATRRPRRTPAK